MQFMAPVTVVCDECQGRRFKRQVLAEHATDLIARADWIVDLGPGGGAHGGELLYSGPLERFLDEVESPTAEELRKHLSWERG